MSVGRIFPKEAKDISRRGKNAEISVFPPKTMKTTCFAKN